MEHKGLYLTTALMLCLAASCHKPEYNYFSEDNANLQSLTVSVSTKDDRMVEYPAVIDEAAGTVTVSIPYYLSDTEPIQADLTQMRISAKLPLGATFNPALTGLHDLGSGFKSTLTYADGKAKEYTFLAVYVKSDLALLRDVAMDNPDIVYAIVHPSEGNDGSVTVPYDEETEPFITKTRPKVSPWATLQCEAYDEATGLLDLTKAGEIKVVSQSGNVTGTYKVVLDEPEGLEGLRKVKSLFAFQPTEQDPHGMVKDANRSMAVVGDYLILSNAEDVSKMPVYDRMSGEYLGNDLVNTDGEISTLDEKMKFWAIASDDAGHLVAATYVDTSSDAENGTVRIFAWTDGIDHEPKSIEWAGFYNWATGASWAFSNMKIAGDVTQGALIATSASAAGRAAFSVVGSSGKVTDRFSAQAHEGSLWWSASIIPLDANATSAENVHFASVSGNFRQYITYDGTLLVPDASYWYMGGGEYQRNAVGGDIVKVGDHTLMATMNGWYAGSPDPWNNNSFYYQLVVSDIGDAPGETSLTDGLIFASRSSTDDAILSDMGYGVAGMISPFAYEPGFAVLGPNGYGANKSQIGDVVFGKSSEKRVQVYAMAMNLGLIAYEISYY